MKLRQYRISSGAYQVGEFLILRVSRSWQVRDKFRDIEQEFSTLRESIAYAKTQQALILAKDVRPATLPIEPAQMLRI